MANKQIDLDKKQAFIDVFKTKNEYKLVDDYVIVDGNKHPYAIVVPGGGYSLVCSFIEGVPIAKKLNEKGISAFILYYRVREKAKYPNPQDDLARAIKEIANNKDKYNLLDNYSIWGASAGGHLVASFGTDNMGYLKYDLKKPCALVLTYPVITMNSKYTHMGTHNNLLGKKPTKELEDFTSVELHVNETYPRTFVWCGNIDSTVNPINLKLLCDELKKNNIEHEYHIYDHVEHGVGPGTGTNAEGWIDKAVDFWLNK